MNRMSWLMSCAIVGTAAAALAARPTTMSVDVKSKPTDAAWKPRTTVLLNGLKDFTPPAKPIALDRFGGRMDRPIGKPTGFFGVIRQNGRAMLVDPDGNAFYSIGMNAVDVLGSPTARAEMNQRHGQHQWPGWLVTTQTDRGRFYQNFTIGLAADPNCVGWHWFKYMDNDPLNTKSDPSNRDSNKGILTSKLQPYQPLIDQMKSLNESAYALLDYFDARAKK